MHSTKLALNKFLQCNQKFQLINENDCLLLAVSGGSDSTALTLLILQTQEILKVKKIGIAHYNHGLRGEESERDEKFCRSLAEKFHLPFYTDKLPISLKRKNQLFYREKRYQFLQEMASQNGYHKIVTAHTQEDNVETILMRIFSGTGLNGLKGIPAIVENIIRPLLNFSRKELEDFLLANSQDFVLDSSNLSDKYTRNALRLKILPLMKDIFPAYAESILRLSQTAGIDNEFIHQCFNSECKEWLSSAENLYRIPAGLLLHPAIFRRLVMQLADNTGIELSAKNIEEIEAGYYGQKSGSKILIQTRTGYVTLEYGELIFHPSELKKIENIDGVLLKPNEETIWNNYKLNVVIKENSDRTYEKNISGNLLRLEFDADRLDFPLTVRSIQPGDKIEIAPGKHKKISRIFIDKKIPLLTRNSIAVICDNKSVIAIAGFLPEKVFYRTVPRSYITGDTKKNCLIAIKPVTE